jgi:hypothetical protein
MAIAIKVAALPEPASDRSSLQPMSTILSLAPIAGLGDRRMSRASNIISLLSSLTDDQVVTLAPVDRRLLQDQLERVHRMVAGARIISDARKATSGEGEPKRSTAAFLDELRDGQGRE